VLDSDVNLVEIDLLRGGQRLLPYPDLAEVVHHLACHYLVLINRQRSRLDDGMDYTLYPISLYESLPCLPIPLANDDPDIALDLQVVTQEINRRALYHRMIDYSRPPDPRNGAKVALSSDVIGIQQVVSSARQVDLLALTSSGNLSHMRHFSAYRVSLALLRLNASGFFSKYDGISGFFADRCLESTVQILA
jgi:hypothetical protein